MIHWLHKLLNPHCVECFEEHKLELSESHCNSCETLKEQLAIANHEKNLLLNKLLEKTNPIINESNDKPPIPVPMSPRNIPWNVRRQMLEAEDRKQAQLMKSAPKPITTEELEKEMNIASNERENAK